MIHIKKKSRQLTALLGNLHNLNINYFSKYFCSNLEKAQKELEPEEDLIDPKLLYPAFAVSMIVNLLMGGHILSQVRDMLRLSHHICDNFLLTRCPPHCPRV